MVPYPNHAELQRINGFSRNYRNKNDYYQSIAEKIIDYKSECQNNYKDYKLKLFDEVFG